MKKLILATTALVALSAAPAHAGPVMAAVAWVGNTIGAAMAAGGWLGALTQMAVGTGMSLLASALMPAPGQAGIDVSFDVEFGDTLPLEFVVGDYATAGRRKYIADWGKEHRFITEVIEVSCLPQGLNAMWVNDEGWNRKASKRGAILKAMGRYQHRNTAEFDAGAVPSEYLDIGTPLTNLGDDGDRIFVKWVDGTQTAADPLLIHLFGSDADYPWPAAMIGTGKSYAIVTTRFDDDTLTSYPSFLFQPQPLPLYDIRRDSTNGGVGGHRWDDPSTWLPTRNPAVIAYNVARGIYYGSEWVFGGKNLAAWRLPSAEWIAAANECDDEVAISGGGTEPRYRCGAAITVDMQGADVLEQIGRSSNMRFAEVGGMLKPIVGLPASAALAISDDSIIITEGQSFKPFYPVSETYNSISATYPEPGEKWTSKDAPEYIDTDSRAADGGRHLPVGVDYPAAPYARQVQRLMRAQMRDYRRMRRHQFYLPPEAYALEPGVDMVSWSSTRNGYENKLFVVESVSKTPGMNVLVSLREVDPSDYDWSSDWEAPVVVTPPKNVTPYIQEVDNFQAIGATITDAYGSARRAAILASCDGDAVGVRHIQIEGRRAGSTDVVISTVRPYVEPHSWYLANVLPATTYEVRARLMSGLTPKSAWSSWRTVTTPDVRLGSMDLRYDEITEQVREDVADLEAWSAGTGDYLRELRNEIAVIRDAVVEVDGAQWLSHDSLTREIGVQVGTARAEYTEWIDVAVGETEALAVRMETVDATIGLGNHAGASDTILARVTETEDGVVALGENILTTDARVDRVAASGLLRITSEAAPSGSQTRVALRAEASDGDASHSAAMFLEATSDGKSQAIMVADRFAVASATGPAASRGVPFVVDGGVVYMDIAFIRDLTVTTLKIADNAVTIPVAASANTEVILTDGTVQPLVSVSLNRVGAPTLIWATAQIGSYTTQGIARFEIVRVVGAVENVIAVFPAVSGVNGTQTSAAFMWRDDNLGVGGTSYRLQAVRLSEGSYTGDPQIVNRSISALHVKK